VAWVEQRYEEIVPAREQRLLDLILAGVVGWSWPQYWMNKDNIHHRLDEVLEATKDEVMPWQEM
jgi:hypothetical protein